MNRRRLILTALGALAALPFGAKAVSFVSAAPKPKVPIAELYITVSQDVNEALSKQTAVVSRQQPLVAIGQLIISNEAEAEAFINRMAEAIRKAAKEK